MGTWEGLHGDFAPATLTAPAPVLSTGMSETSRTHASLPGTGLPNAWANRQWFLGLAQSENL